MPSPSAAPPPAAPAVPSAVDFGLALKRAQHLFTLRIDEALRPLNLNMGLWAVMREVARTPGASASELARASFHTPQTLGGLLQRLQARGLVERSTGRGRIVENHLTPQGAGTLVRATAAAESVIQAALARLDVPRTVQAHQFLSDLAASIAALPDAGDPAPDPPGRRAGPPGSGATGLGTASAPSLASGVCQRSLSLVQSWKCCCPRRPRFRPAPR